MHADAIAPDLDHAPLAATRSALYALFAFMFAYPDADWVAAIRAGEVAQRMAELCAGIDVVSPPPLNPDRNALANAGSDDDALAIEYTRLFDTGPISLHGGHHHGARMPVMEEVLRFYEHFGLTPDPRSNELPDHLVAELEFMHFLCHREAIAPASGAEPYRRAQRDYLQRQLGRWAPQLHERLVEQQALPFFSEATRLLAGFLSCEQGLLQAPHPM